ncbi:MAG: arginase family enzyme [Phycisphaerales bacterium]|jgi:arginase family enzyme
MRPPHTIHAPWPEGIPSGRFASTIERDDPSGCAVALLGLPDDTGVRLNHGRPGAGEGPAAFRAAMSRYGSATPARGAGLPRVYDAGNVQPADELNDTHARVTEAVEAIHRAGMLPVAIGGGHDLTFPFVRAAANVHGPLAGIYLDAHLDVRSEPGSGMPFRALVDGGHARELHIHGLDRNANSQEHLTWFQAHGGHVDSFTHDDPPDAWPPGDLFVSLDLDVIDQAFAPGVSANNPNGWTPAKAEAWCAAAGRCDRVRCFDIMELCPPHDIAMHTSRLAVHLFYAFLAGFAERAT